MNEAHTRMKEEQLRQKANHAQRIIYIIMGIFILLPFLVVWITGAFRF